MKIKLHYGDTNPECVDIVNLKNCYCNGKATIVRVINIAGIPYSFIYCENCGEVWSAETKHEKKMLMKWGYKNV